MAKSAKWILIVCFLNSWMPLFVSKAMAESKPQIHWRTLLDYNREIYKTDLESTRSHFSNGVSHYINDYVIAHNIDPEPSLLQLIKSKWLDIRKPIVWTDMGGGFGVPMREVKRGAYRLVGLNSADIDVSYVDAVDWEKERDSDATRKQALDTVGFNIFDNIFRPQFLKGSVETIKLQRRPDLLTAVDSIQYVDHKLETLVHWYNSLADNGIMIVASDMEWAGWVRNQGAVRIDDSDIFSEFIMTLKKAGISVALTKNSSASSDAHVMALLVIKKPGTSLSLNTRFVGVESKVFGYDASYYSKPTRGRQPVKVL